MTQDNRKPTTTDAGIPVASDEHSLSVGPDGPLVLHDHYLIEQMANFNRERIPERQPHAKGSGAFGHFEVTEDPTVGSDGSRRSHTPALGIHHASTNAIGDAVVHENRLRAVVEASRGDGRALEIHEVGDDTDA